MQPSLLFIRKHLKPLTWLLGVALLISISPHLAQGLVLCIGDGHVEVEASGAVHHAARTGAAAAPDLAGQHVAGGSVFEASGAPCIDVPLRAARGNDLCHQAVQGSTTRADVLLPETLLAAAAGLLLASQPAAQKAAAPPHPSSDVPAASSLYALGSVVLLI